MTWWAWVGIALLIPATWGAVALWRSWRDQRRMEKRLAGFYEANAAEIRERSQ